MLQVTKGDFCANPEPITDGDDSTTDDGSFHPIVRGLNGQEHDPESVDAQYLALVILDSLTHDPHTLTCQACRLSSLWYSTELTSLQKGSHISL